MAGDWIKMRADLLTHPKIVRMVSALKADKLRVIGGLHAVWCLFDMHSEDGRLDGYTAEILDDHLGWPGFSAAMMKIDWLIDEDGESLSVPRFDEHNGKSAKRRAQETIRKQEARKMSANDADEKRTREEKRREEKKETPYVASDAGRPACPHEQIIALYHELLPTLPAVKVWNDKRKQALKSRWLEDEKRQTLDFWRKYFNYVATSDFLTGRSGTFQATLEWLVNSSNFVKVIEGNYENRKAA